MSCEKCNVSDNPEELPYIVHELELTRYVKRERHLIGAAVIACAALIASNIAWAYVVTCLIG